MSAETSSVPGPAAAPTRRPASRARVAEIALVAIAALAFFAVHLGGTLPVDNDALYADVVREMLRTGNWLDPRIHGVPFLDKPPLHYWVAAAVAAVFGFSEGTLRLAAAAFGAAGVAVVYALVRRVAGARAPACLAALLLLGAAQYAEYARRVYMEVPVAVLAFLSGLAYLGGRPLAGGALAGLGFMTKSLPGLLGLCGYLGWLVVRRDFAMLRRPRLWASVGVCVLVAAPWHLYACLSDPQTFLDFTWRLHVRDQVMSAQPWSAGGPLFYLIETARVEPVLAAVVPLSLLLFGVSPTARREPAAGFLLVNVAVQVLLYSLSDTKKSYYLLTAYPFAVAAAGILAAPWLARHRLACLLPLPICALRLLPLKPHVAEYQRPLAAEFARVAPASAKLYCLDTYCAAAQFYARRRAVFVVSDPTLARTLERIPYLRYGRLVEPWSRDDLGRRMQDGSTFLLAGAGDASRLLDAAPSVEVVARNRAFWLLRGGGRAPEREAVEVLVLADARGAVVEEWCRTHGLLGVALGDERALGVPDPPALVLVGAPEGHDWPAIEAYVRRGGVAVVAYAHGAPPPLGETGGAAVPANQALRVGAVGTWLGVPAAAVTGEPIAKTASGAVVAAVTPLDRGYVVRVGFDFAAAVIAQRQGRPAPDRDVDGNGAVQPADWLSEADPPALRGRPHADEAADALLDRLADLARRPLARAWPLPGRWASLVITTADQDFADDVLVRGQFESFARLGARATLMVTWPTGGAPDIGRRPDGTVPTLSSGLAGELIRAGHSLGMHPNLWAMDDPARAGARVLVDHARAMEARLGVRPLVSRNHHLVWYGWDQAARDLAAAGVRMSFDYMAVGDPLGFAGGVARPARFVDRAGRPLDIYQQPTVLDDYPLRADESEARLGSLTARAEELLRAACRAGVPLAVNTHPAYYATHPGWVDALLRRGVPAWDAERWLEFTRSRRRTSLRERGFDGAALDLELDLPSEVALVLPASWRGRALREVKLDGAAVSARAPTCGGSLPAPARARLVTTARPGIARVHASYE